MMPLMSFMSNVKVNWDFSLIDDLKKNLEKTKTIPKSKSHQTIPFLRQTNSHFSQPILQNLLKIKQGNDCIDNILQNSSMLFDYFNIIISKSGKLSSLPLLFNGYMPTWSLLPDFVYDLNQALTLSDEKECFKSISEALANLFAFECNTDNVYILKNILKSMRTNFKPCQDLDKNIRLIACTEKLYRVFERC